MLAVAIASEADIALRTGNRRVSLPRFRQVMPEGTVACMSARSAVLEALGGEEGCRRLSAAFYARVGKDPVLRPFFPGKSLRCATEEFAAFLIQFLGGDEKQTQFRSWLSLRESHARFQIGPNARRAWLKNMEATLDAAPLDATTKNALGQLFSHSSAYVIGRDAGEPDHEELATRWSEQRVLDRVIADIVEVRDDEGLALAPRFVSRPSVFVGLLARMVQSGRAKLIHFVINAVESDPSLLIALFGGCSSGPSKRTIEAQLNKYHVFAEPETWYVCLGSVYNDELYDRVYLSLPSEQVVHSRHFKAGSGTAARPRKASPFAPPPKDTSPLQPRVINSLHKMRN